MVEAQHPPQKTYKHKYFLYLCQSIFYQNTKLSNLITNLLIKKIINLKKRKK